MDDHLIDQASDVPSIILFHKSFQFIFYNFTKIKIKSFECPNSKPLFCFQSIKIILGPSDAWSMKRATQKPWVLY